MTGSPCHLEEWRRMAEFLRDDYLVGHSIWWSIIVGTLQIRNRFETKIKKPTTRPVQVDRIEETTNQIEWC